MPAPTRLETPETSRPALFQPALAKRLGWSWRMQRTNFMMNHAGGWMGGWASGGMWVWTVIGVLVIVLLVVVISKLLKK